MNLKAIFVLGCTSFFAWGAAGQITINADDAPAFGEVYANAIDTLIADIDVGPAGAEAQTWSFLNLDADEAFTNTVVMPSETPAAGLFPNATFAFEGSNGLYSFAEVADDALLAAGGSAPGPNGQIFTVPFDPGQQLLALPSTYGTTFDSEFGFTLEIDGSEFGADSVRIIEYGTVSAEVDAFGEITVPAGTFEVLRQRSVITTADSIYAKIFGTFILVDVIENTTITYEWWGQDGVGTVCSVDFDAGGSPISATYLQAINPSDEPPVAGFSAELLSDGQVQFTDESSNMPLSWSWDFGDGNMGTDQNPLHTYTGSGTYVVCLTATNAAGSNTSCQEVAVVVPPEVSFTFEDQGGGVIAFTDASDNQPITWDWDFGDGNTSTGQNPVHTYTQPGTYTVCLTAANTAGSNTSCQELTVVLPPLASFTFEDQGGGTLAFTDASGNSPVEWSWDFDDGNTSDAQNPVHTYTANGTYTVCLSATNSAGTDTECQEVPVVIVGTSEAVAVAYARAYPSPAEDWLRIDFNEWQGRPVALTAFGLNGQQLFARDLKKAPTVFEVNVSEWAPGSYYLRIEGDGQMQTLAVTVR